MQSLFRKTDKVKSLLVTAGRLLINVDQKDIHLDAHICVYKEQSLKNLIENYEHTLREK